MYNDELNNRKLQSEMLDLNLQDKEKSLHLNSIFVTVND